MAKTEEYGSIPTDSKGMLIDGVAASSVIDSSGEVVSIEGVDCSQFDEDAGIMLNFEHNEGTGSSPTNEAEGAGSLVGKVVFLKKIFSQSDVDGERQQKYFDKCKHNPMIYVCCRLFDSSGHASAIALAATIRDNAKHHEPIAARFSIEGSTLSKDSNKITQSIFRRLALTFKPANKTAISGLLSDPQADKESKIEKAESNPLFAPIGGSQTIECDPVLEVLEKKTADEMDVGEGYNDWASKLKPEHLKSMAYYKGSGFEDINPRLRTPSLFDNPGRYSEHIKNLDSAIKSGVVPKDLIVYRATNIPVEKLPILGKKFVDRGYVSTSLVKDYALGSAESIHGGKTNAILKIRVPQGARGAYIDHHIIRERLQIPEGKVWGDYPDESELLLPRGSVFKCHGVEKGVTTGGRFITQGTYFKVPQYELELLPNKRRVSKVTKSEEVIPNQIQKPVDRSDRFTWKEGELEPVEDNELEDVVPESTEPGSKLLPLIGKVAVIHSIAKALTAGSMDCAPSALTGGAALQRECFLGNKKNQLLAKIRDTQKPFSKEELRAFIRAELPGVSEEFLNHFERITEDYLLKKSLAKKESPYRLTPEEPKAKVAKVPIKNSEGVYKVKGKSGLFSDGPKGEPNLVRGSIWNHKDQKSYLAPIKKNVKRAYFDEEKGLFHTPFGSFQAQKIPYVTDAKDEEAYKQLLNHPNLQKVMDVALPNWYKVHLLAGARQLPEEIPMHSVMFSIMSANNRVPMNELQLARMIDAMKKTGLDPRKPGFEAIAPFMKESDSTTELPTHSRAHFEGNPDMYMGGITTGVKRDLFGSKIRGRPRDKRFQGEINSITPFMFDSKDGFIARLSKYHQVHQKVMDIFKKHGNSMVDIAGALKDLVPGLRVKTALFTAGMSGGGSAPVPDTHHIRRTFGLHLKKDAETLKKVKDQMWDPENYQNTIIPYARWFAKNNPAVKHLLENPKFAHMFKGHEEDAAFPGFWLDWQAIQPWEKMKGLPSMSSTSKATHQPVWDAYAPYMKSEKGDNLDPTLPLRTALVHQKYLENYGEVPASFLYYSYIVPKLLEAADHRKKFESGLDFLAKSNEIEAQLVELRKTIREAVEGAQVQMPEVYQVDIKHGDKTNPAGRYMIHEGQIRHLEDYHGILDSILPEGPVNPDAIAKLHGMRLSDNFQVRQHEPQENEEPQEVRANLPQVEVSLAPTPKRAPVFEYYRPGLDKPHVVEFGVEGAALDGQKLDERELALMLENANSGLAQIKWKKSEEPLLKAENLMPPTEALRHIRELVAKGLVHPDIERSLTNHIYVDPMTGVGNRLSYREFRDKNRPGVWASMDQNDFKGLNDVYGHDTGDEAIKAAGGAFREAGNKIGTGKIFRPGGDEFAAWFPSYEDASQFIRYSKNHMDALPPVGGVHKHSFSVGLGSDFGEADKALLEAKKQKFDPVTKQRRFLPGNTPHLGHSLVPGTEGPLSLEKEGPPKRTLPAQLEKKAHDYIPVGLPNPEQVGKVGSASFLGGARKKSIYRDKKGKDYIFKPAVDKDGVTPSPFRAEAQEAVSRIASKVRPGAHIPVRKATINGQLGTLQPLMQSGKFSPDYSAPDPAKLTPQEQEDVGAEHVIDWLTSGHDSHPGNFVKMGGRIMGVDKEQAFRWLGKDKLSTQYHPNSIYGTSRPYYNDFWESWKNGGHNFDPKKLDPYISRAENIPDLEYAEILRPYAQSLFGNFKEQKDFLVRAINRKHSLRHDFGGFIQGLRS